MDKQQILEIAKSDPKFSQAVLQLEQQIGDMPVTAEGLDELVKMLEAALNNPDKYAEIMAAAVKDGYFDEGDFPPQPDAVFLVSILVLLYGMQERAKSQQGFARGGLAQAARQLRSKGRNGDTILAHINPAEADMLRRAGGSGSINPNTGLPEYGWFKKFLSVALPIALTFLAPGIGTAIGASLGASAAWAPVLGGALIGGASSALGGGNFLQGAALGGLGGGLGGMAGSAANNALGLGLGASGQAMLGSGLVGGALGAATGQGFMQGAVQGATGQALGSALGGAGGGAMQAGGTQFGNMLTAGYDPKQAATGGVLAGLATSMAPKPASNVGLKPSSAVVDGLRTTPMTSTVYNPSYNLTGAEATLPAGYDVGDMGTGTGPGATATTAAPAPSSGFGLNAGTALKGLTLMSMLGGAPKPVQQAVSSLSPAQQEYFNRPSVQWDWTRMQKDAAESGVGLGQYMAQNWNDISTGAYNQPTEPRKLARGGALSQIAYAVGGPGSGRDDEIDAKLSDGEYVFDAETVAMLGDGSGKAGAARLDQMRASIRSHKGKNLAKGRISPDAKSPLAYLKGLK